MCRIENFEFKKYGEKPNAYELAILEKDEYLFLKSTFEFKVYKHDYDFDAFLINENYVFILNEETYCFNLYKSVDDFECYLDMAYRNKKQKNKNEDCLLYTSPSPRD